MKPFKRFLSYLGKNTKHLVLIFISVFIVVLAEISQPFLLGKAIDSALNEHDLIKFLVFIFVTEGLLFVGVIFSRIFEYTVGKLTQEMTAEMRMDVYKKINSISIDTIFKERSGNLVQYEINDIESISNGINSTFKSLFRGLIVVVFTIVMMLFVNWLLALIVIVLTPLSVLVSRFIAKSNHKYFKEQAKLQSVLNQTSLEAINNTDLVQAFNKEDAFIKKFEKEDLELKKQGVKAQFAASWINPSTRLVNNTIYAIVGIFGITLIYVSGLSSMAEAILAVMTLGKLSSFLSYTTQYTKPFNEISSVISEYEVAKSSFERLNTFLNKEDDADNGTTQINNIDSIEFKNVDFSYDPNVELIKNLNLRINKGQKIAIVGPTGAGKTTLINLLLNYYSPSSGDILFNGVSYREITKQSLRKNFGLVLQETWMFNGTILDNVRYAKPSASDEEVVDACKKARVHDIVMTLPYGYQTKISSKEDLSEGEKQMISLARVMLLNPNNVILDEATSNVDTRSEKLINDAFDAVMKNKTSIVIAHRLSTIKNADIILVVNDGKIVGQGSHEELLKKNDLYRSMFNSQFETIN